MSDIHGEWGNLLKPEEIRKWKERFDVDVNEKQYWERVVEFLLNDEELDTDSGNDLLDFINSKEVEFLFDKKILSQEEKQKKSM